MSDYYQKHERELHDFVGREVIYCVSTLITDLIQNPGDVCNDEYCDDLIDLQYRERPPVVEGLQVRYIINLDERGDFSATLYKIDENGDDLPFFEVTAESAKQLIEDGFVDDIRDCEQVADHVANITAGMDYPDHYLDANDEVILTADDEQDEVLEHWIVTDWLAKKLEEHGERVVFDLHGLTVWGRCTSGQSIALDGVISEIHREINNGE